MPYRLHDADPNRLLPGFTGSALTGLGTTPPHAPHVPTSRSNRWIVASLAGLTLAFVALATYVVTHPPAPIVIASPTIGAPIEPPPPAEVRIAVRDATHDRAPRDLAANVEARTDAPSGIAVATSDDRTARGIPRTRRAPDRTPPPVGAPPKVDRDVPVECVIDPASCAVGDAKAPKGPPPPPKAADDRPLTLGQSEIRAGIAPLKPTAKACATRHGGTPGETVRVKLSIAGPTGAVISTQAEAPHQGTPLGNCVAATLKKATFATFKKPVIGLVYAITM